MSDSDDLTAAYLWGYHRRDDEVKALKARVEHLEKERDCLRTMLSRTLHKYGLIRVPAQECLSESPEGKDA